MDKLDDVTSQDQMIREQVIRRGIHDPRLIQAMRDVPRDRFFPAEDRHHAYADGAAAIGHGQTISQPYIVALMTEQLDIHPHHKVLEIGTGSGYHAAILARLAAEVYTIERIKPLLDEAWERLMELNLRNVHFRHGDGTDGWPEAAPFDRILIAAGAPRVPTKLLASQLTEGGIAVLPVGSDDEQMLMRITRRGRELHTADICPCRFVKLIGNEGWEDS